MSVFRAKTELDLTRRLTKKFRRLTVLVLSMYDEPEYALRAIDAGAMGYMVKHEAAEKIDKALHQVLNGRPYLSPSVAGEIAFDAVVQRRKSNRIPRANVRRDRRKQPRQKKTPKPKPSPR